MRAIPALSNLDKRCLDVHKLEGKQVLSIKRWKDERYVSYVFNFISSDIKVAIPLTGGTWKRIFDTSEKIWDGPRTLHPERLIQGEGITMRSQSLAFYMKGKI